MLLNEVNLNPNIKLTEDGEDIPSDENLNNESHHLTASADGDYIHLNFSSRLAMYDFARNLMHEALFNKGDTTEFYPLEFEGKLEIVEGVRLTSDSRRIFVNYPCKNE